MRLTLKQGRRGESKQRLDTDPLAKPTETHSAVLALYPMKSAAPSQKRDKFCYRNSSLGHPSRQTDLPGLVRGCTTQCCGHPLG